MMTEQRFKHKDNSLFIDGEYFCELDDGEEICKLLNNIFLTKEKLENKIPTFVFEIIDSYIRGMKDETGIDPNNQQFQEKMESNIQTLKDLREELEDPSEFISLKKYGYYKLPKRADNTLKKSIDSINSFAGSFEGNLKHD